MKCPKCGEEVANGHSFAGYGFYVQYHPECCPKEMDGTICHHDHPDPEIQRLQGIIDQHNLCHDLHGKVDAKDFAKGCETEQRRIYGCAPHVDQIQKLKTLLKKIRDTVEVVAFDPYPIEEPDPNGPWLPVGLTIEIDNLLKELENDEM